MKSQKLLVLDADNTLYNVCDAFGRLTIKIWEVELYIAMLKYGYEITQQKANEILFTQYKKHGLACFGVEGIDPTELFNSVHDRLAKILPKYFAYCETTKNLLTQAKESGYEIAILSHAQRGYVKKHIEIMQLTNVINPNYIFGQDTIGLKPEYSKMNLYPFEHVADVTGIPLHNHIVVEDTPKNLIVPEKAGARCISIYGNSTFSDGIHFNDCRKHAHESYPLFTDYLKNLMNSA